MRTWMTVRFRIVGAFFLLAGALLSFVMVFAPLNLRREHAKQLRRTAGSVATVLGAHVAAARASSDRASSDRASSDPQRLAQSLDHVLEVPDVVYAAIVDADGTESSHVGEPVAGWDLPDTGPAFFATDTHIVVQQVASADAGAGSVRIVMSRASIGETLKNFFRFMYIVLGLIVFLSVLAAVILSRIVVRPIEQITRGVRELERGTLERLSAPGRRGDEFYELAQAINRMREELRGSSKKLARAARRASVRADKLERANEELDRFSYVASHDLRAPLRGIAALSEFIADDIEGVAGVPKDVRDNLELLRRRVQRLDHLLMSLLEYSRVGRAQAEKEPVDVLALVEGVVDVLAVRDGFEVKIDKALPTFMALRAPLERVFMHLIGNAVKHHDKDVGLVEITYSATLEHAVFVVTDDGPGIPTALQEKAFKIFATLKRRDEVEGSGMGLALIQKTVETAGGRLDLQSDGRGCRFIVRWPLYDDEDATMTGVALQGV